MRVLAFGTFDPLHEGHLQFLRAARQLGSTLTVVVARDSVIRTHKGREPFEHEAARLARVKELPWVDDALLGDARPERYTLFKRLVFDVLALGYDQEPDDVRVRRVLDELGKREVRLVRLPSYEPQRYKSSLLRGQRASS